MIASDGNPSARRPRERCASSDRAAAAAAAAAVGASGDDRRSTEVRGGRAAGEPGEGTPDRRGTGGAASTSQFSSPSGGDGGGDARRGCRRQPRAAGPRRECLGPRRGPDCGAQRRGAWQAPPAAWTRPLHRGALACLLLVSTFVCLLLQASAYLTVDGGTHITMHMTTRVGPPCTNEDRLACPKYDFRVYGDSIVGEGTMPAMLNDASDFALKRHLNVEGAVAASKYVMRNDDANTTEANESAVFMEVRGGRRASERGDRSTDRVGAGTGWRSLCESR